MAYSESLQGLISRFRPTDVEADKALLQQKLAEVDAELEKITSEYEQEMAPLRSQLQSLNDRYANDTAPYIAQRDEITTGLSELETPQG